MTRIADKLANEGYYAVVPDFFYGDPWDPENLDRPEPIWEKDHEQEKGAEDAKRIIEALKGKGASSVGAAGFSWGGKVAVDLAKPGLTKAVVLLYPSGVTVDDIKGVQVPIAILCAEVDTLCPPEHVKQYEQALAAKPEVGSFVKLFPGVAHGWAVRYNEDDPEAVKAAEEAHQDMLTWFDKFRKRSENVRFTVLLKPSNPDPNGGGGHVEKIGGLDTYVTGPANSKLAVLLISDIMAEAHYFTPGNSYLLKLADKVATAGYYVVVPDFFYGDPYNPENADRPVLVWLKDHGPDKGFEDAKRVIEALKGKGVSSVGAAGFCWGAKVVVELAKSGPIKAAVLLHPSLVTVDDIKDVDTPISILGAEIDKVSPPELVRQFEPILAAKSGVDGHVKIFPKVVHGWTVRYNEDDPEAVKPAEEAHQDMLEWFDNYLK
ncbi:endo-1,3-1,4-beta-D-glucanase-like [Senna tora]|uniref:Endo-1,3-1,4-beta-D-glucanase-like n=1 Tax=Senna tora TaxID=362788 RepID=A0A834W823_9FABA|nr:endo-1,3-1,4-beta-D-glucanase-like [Senna tora]